MAIEHSFLVSSVCAVKVGPDTGRETPYVADAQGAISVAPGDVLRFKHYKGGGYVALNEQLLHAVSGDIKLYINDNHLHTLVVPEGDALGISSMSIYSQTILQACSLRYEGLA